MPELYHRLFAETPRETPAVGRSAAVRGKLHALASELPEFETLRKQTVRSPLWAGMAATALSESVARALPVMGKGSIAPGQRDADRANALVDSLESLLATHPEHGGKLAGKIEKARTDADGAMVNVGLQARQLDESAIRNAIRAGVDAAQSAIDDAQEALASLGWGDDIGGSGADKDPSVACELARRVRSSAKLARIVELAGRLIMTARAKRATRTDYARSEIMGVEQTGDLARLLPCELANLADDTMTTNLYRKLLERSALGYKLAGSEKAAKGPIVICLDQSGSMADAGKDEWSKAVVLALLDAARAENRAFGIVLYEGGVSASQLFPDASKADPRAILDLLSFTPNGGTSFAAPLRQALDWISTAGTFNRADVVHVTDGSASTAGADEARARAKSLGAHIFGIAIGPMSSALPAWSDDVTQISDVSRDTAAVDLIFDNV